MRTISNFKELKAAIAAEETDLKITDAKLAKKVWVAYKVRKFMPKFTSILGIGGVATILTGPAGLATMTAIATPVAMAASISTGVQIALIIAALTVIALFLKRDVEIEYADKDGNRVTLKYRK